MNILVLSKKNPYPPRDGEAIAILNMARGLAESGHGIWLLAMNTTKHFTPVENIPESLKNIIKWNTVNVNTRIRVARLIMNLIFSKAPYNAVRFRSRKFLLRLKNMLGSQNFDIIQIEGPYLDFYIPAIRELSDAKISLRAHNMEHLIWERRAAAAGNPVRKWYLNVLKRRIKNLETSLLQKIDVLVPISETDLSGFRRMGVTAPRFTCPAGIVISAYEPADLPQEISLFFIGSLDWGPNTEGLDWFFEHVWPAMHQKNRELKLYVAGRNSDFYFQGKILPDQVVICGEIEDAIQFMREHTIMIVPLFSGSGIRVKILEGMAMKKTIITTSTGAEGINVTHGQDILLANSAGEFISWINALIDDPGKTKAIGNQARKFITENFDNLVLSKALTGFYQQQLL
jgi:glycosyltransferase involved in cell wall biosynthesis